MRNRAIPRKRTRNYKVHTELGVTQLLSESSCLGRFFNIAGAKTFFALWLACENRLAITELLFHVSQEHLPYAEVFKNSELLIYRNI